MNHSNPITFPNYMAARGALTQLPEAYVDDYSEVGSATTGLGNVFEVATVNVARVAGNLAISNMLEGVYEGVVGQVAVNKSLFLIVNGLVAGLGSGGTEVRIRVGDPIRGITTGFGELEARHKNDHAVRQIIGDIRSSDTIRYKDKLANRLDALLNAYKEDYEGRALSADSLRAMISFLSANPTFKYPIVSATPDGDPYVQWKHESNRRLSVHFLPTGDARFVIFKPNPMHPNRTDPFGGSTTTDALLDEIAIHGVLDWATE